MAVLSIKEFPDDLYFAMKLDALHKRLKWKEYVLKQLADALPAGTYKTEVPAKAKRQRNNGTI